MIIGGEMTLFAGESACHPRRSEAAIRDGGAANPRTVPEAAPAAVRGKGPEDARVAARLPAQPCGLSGRMEGVACPVPALPPAFAGVRPG